MCTRKEGKEAALEIGDRNIGRQRNRSSRPAPPAEVRDPKDGKEKPLEQNETGERS